MTSSPAAPSGDRSDFLLDSLGYVGVSSDKLDDWASFARDVAGMQLTDSSARTRHFRLDDRAQRFLISDDGGSSGFAGFEVSDAAALSRVADRLDASGVPHAALTASECELRRVTAGLACADPDGNRIEVFWGPVLAGTPFKPGRPIAGFRTGTLGLGHVVLLTPEPRNLVPFYVDVLGFRVSDSMVDPFVGYFFHLNPRHHSLALVKYPGSGIHHVMVELNSLDDVGHGLDLVEQSLGAAVTLGRHSNDHMLSFYARTPSRLMLEYGWGGKSIDVDRWQPRVLPEGPSLWGHERSWLPADLRQRALEARLQAARFGLRYPVHVRDGGFDVMPPDDDWTPNTAVAPLTTQGKP